MTADKSTSYSIGKYDVYAFPTTDSNDTDYEKRFDGAMAHLLTRYGQWFVSSSTELSLPAGSVAHVAYSNDDVNYQKPLGTLAVTFPGVNSQPSHGEILLGQRFNSLLGISSLLNSAEMTRFAISSELRGAAQVDVMQALVLAGVYSVVETNNFRRPGDSISTIFEFMRPELAKVLRKHLFPHVHQVKGNRLIYRDDMHVSDLMVKYAPYFFNHEQIAYYIGIALTNIHYFLDGGAEYQDLSRNEVLSYKQSLNGSLDRDHVEFIKQLLIDTKRGNHVAKHVLREVLYTHSDELLNSVDDGPGLYIQPVESMKKDLEEYNKRKKQKKRQAA
ncbi:MAG: hypothetical protein ACOCXT_03175 [Candidatus Dojkabacteria bacterium]